MSLRTLDREDHVVNLLLYLVGVSLLPLGAVLTVNAHLGAGGIDALNFVLADRLGVNTSVAVLSTSLVSLVLAAFIRRSYPRIQTFLTSLLIGLFTDFWRALLSGVQGTELLEQLALLAVGLVVTAFGVAVYMISPLPSGPNDDLVLAMREAGVSIWASKVGFDAVCVVLALALGGEIWLGTIICTFGLGPVIDFFVRRVEKLPAVNKMLLDYRTDNKMRF